MKKFISLLLSILMLLSITAGMSFNASAANSQVEKAISWAVGIANDNSHGYKLGGQGPEYDCSSLVSAAFAYAGFNISYANTSSMLTAFTNAGFTAYTKGQVALERGDILLKPGTHTEIYLGNNQCVAAHADKDGKPGDSNGKEIEVRNKSACTFCNNQQYTYILRYEESTPPSNTQLSFDKQVYGLNDKIYASFSADNATKYVVQVWYGSQLIYTYETIDTTVALNCSHFGPGTFAAYVTSYNSNGYCMSATKSFTIADKLSEPSISINKNEFAVEDTINISVSVKGGPDYYGLQIWKGNEVVYQKQFIGHEVNIPCSLLEIGDFAAFVSCVNSSGSINTDTVNFIIKGSEQTCINSHDYQLAFETEANCIETGTKVYICTVCGDRYTEMSAITDHTVIVDEAVAPTCTKTGLTEGSHCSVCGNVLREQSVIPTIDHTYTAEVTKAPSCTRTGTMLHTCTKCGENYTEVIPMSEHSYDEGVVTKEPTSTATGIKTYTCSGCGDSYTEVLPKLNHTHSYDDGVVTKAASCSQTGLKVYTCECGDVYTEILPKLAHKEVADPAVTATCEHTGLTAGSHCSVCGEPIVKQDIIKAKDHIYGEEITRTATCTRTGIKTFTCMNCGDSYTEVIPMKNHNYVGEVTKAATSTSTGIMTYTCTGCGDSYTEVIPKLVNNGWQPIDGKKYYYVDGEPLKGKQLIDGKTYIFSKTDGSMMTGKVRCDGKYYIMSKASGEMLYGMVRCDGKYYIMSKTTGEMLYGKVSCNGKGYIMSKSTGEMLYGKVTCNGYTYICSKSDGHIFKNMNVTCNGVKYYCNSSGVAKRV